jgi:hypothetical protein
MGSLCHGYFWALTEKFDFEASVAGRAIHNEIVRRRSKHFWVEGVHMPPPMMELIGTPGMTRPQPKLPLHEIESEALLPFDDRLSLIESISVNYQETPASPPVSPGASPGRSFTHPVLSSTLSTIPAIEAEQELPSHFREQMLTDWTREAAMLAIHSGSKSASLSGSRTGTTGTGPTQRHNNRLAVNGNHHHHQHGPPSPYGSQHNLRPGSQSAVGARDFAPGSKLRKSSVRSNLSPAVSNASSHRAPVTTVDQLKLALSGLAQPSNLSSNGGVGVGVGGADDDSGDSMVSYDMAPSELSFIPTGLQAPAPAAAEQQNDATGRERQKQQQPPLSREGSRARSRSMSRERKGSPGEVLGGPLTSHPTRDSTVPSPPAGQQQQQQQHDPEKVDMDDDDDAVPPVPPLPASVPGPGPSDLKTLAAATTTMPTVTMAPAPVVRSAKRSLKSRDGDSVLSRSFGGLDIQASGGGAAAAAALDLNSMLKGIDSRAGEISVGNVTRPPY